MKIVIYIMLFHSKTYVLPRPKLLIDHRLVKASHDSMKVNMKATGGFYR